MATENPNPKNVAIVAEVTERLKSADTVIATEYRGLNVPQQAALRAKVRDAGGEIKIYKNTLVRLAAQGAGIDIGAHLSGPTALALTIPEEGQASDPAALAKALQDFADENEAFVIKGGVMDGDPISEDNVKALSKIPPRDVLLSQIAGVIAAPMAKFASLLQTMPRDLASLIKALHDKGGAGVATEAAPADDAPAEDAPAEDAPAEDAVAEAAAPTESEEASASDEAAHAAGSDDAVEAPAEDSAEQDAPEPEADAAAGGAEEE